MTDLQKKRVIENLGTSAAAIERSYKMARAMDANTIIPDLKVSIESTIKRLDNTLKLLESS